jgi:hypothetical protein
MPFGQQLTRRDATRRGTWHIVSLPVLHCILGSTGQQLGDLTPPVSKVFLCMENGQVLICEPVASLDRRVEVIEPALSALLADATWQLVQAALKIKNQYFLNGSWFTSVAMLDHLTLPTPKR